MYICIVSRGYPTDQYKMNGIFEYDQAKALVQAGQKVVMAVVDLRSIRRKRKLGVSHCTQDGMEIYTVSLPIGRCPAALRDRIGIWALRRLSRRIEKEQGKPDILHGHFTNISYMASDWAKRENIPFVVTEHASQMNKQDVPADLLKEAKSAYRRADLVIAVGTALAKNMQRLTGIQAKVIGNVVDAEPFIKNRRLNVDNNFSFAIVSAGNLIPSKRMDLLVSAFIKFHRRHKESTLTIFGNGELRPLLEKQISINGLDSVIRLMGICPHTEMAEIYKTADCFALPSASETFGVAYIEAMAAGLPVIATKCGGPEDFVNDTNGIFIPTDDEEALVNAMEFMLSNRALYDPERISRDIIERFSANAIAEKLLACYRQILPAHQEG